MQYLALATDYDGTLAHDGHVEEETLQAVMRLRSSGRKVILVERDERLGGRDDRVTIDFRTLAAPRQLLRHHRTCTRAGAGASDPQRASSIIWDRLGIAGGHP